MKMTTITVKREFGDDKKIGLHNMNNCIIEGSTPAFAEFIDIENDCYKYVELESLSDISKARSQGGNILTPAQLHKRMGKENKMKTGGTILERLWAARQGILTIVLIVASIIPAKWLTDLVTVDGVYLALAAIMVFICIDIFHRQQKINDVKTENKGN